TRFSRDWSSDVCSSYLSGFCSSRRSASSRTAFAYWFLKTPRFSPQEAEAVREAAERRELQNPLQRAYIPVLRFATRRRLTTVVIGLVVFAGTMALTPALKTNFLDSTGNNTTQITQRMPAGTDLAV